MRLRKSERYSARAKEDESDVFGTYNILGSLRGVCRFLSCVYRDFTHLISNRYTASCTYCTFTANRDAQCVCVLVFVVCLAVFCVLVLVTVLAMLILCLVTRRSYHDCAESDWPR